MNPKDKEGDRPGDCSDDPSCCPPEASCGGAPADCCGPGSDAGGGSRGSSRLRIVAFAIIIIAAVAVAAWSLLRDRPADIAGGAVTSAYGLAEIAPGMDFAFVLLSGGDAVGSKDAAVAVEGAAEALVGQGVQMGFCTVEAGSPAHSQLVDSLGIDVFPAVVLMGASCGQSVVTGEITEDELLRTYLLATCGASCGPAGCGASSSCCPQ